MRVSIPRGPYCTITSSSRTTNSARSPSSSAASVAMSSHSRGRCTPWMPALSHGWRVSSLPSKRPACCLSLSFSVLRLKITPASVDPAARLVTPLVLVLLHFAHQLLREAVDRSTHVARRFARTQRVAFREDRRLRDLVLADRRVLLGAQLELDLYEVGELLVELAQLLFRIAADRVADLDVLALQLETHVTPPPWVP